MLSVTKDKIKLSKNLFPVIGIGASAGGLEAFKKFIKAIPQESGMAYIFVQHLHPDHSSSLPNILQRETSIPVNEIKDNVQVKPDKIYIIPANKMLVATDGILQLSPRPPKDQKNMPIDIFFSSLAEVHQSHAIGVVLSGNGTDGTIGLKDIKGQGGITFAQELDSAAYDAMPKSAIAADVVDFILAPEKIPAQLLALNRTLNILPDGGHPEAEQLTEEESFRQILSLIRIQKDVDFTFYKQTTIRRRILRRVAILKMEKIIEYLAYLKENKPELETLFQDLLIPVTSFFRDPSSFEKVCETIFPELVKGKSPGNPLRIWVAGCSTGKEAYSLGICLHEYLRDKAPAIKLQIFATDISEKSIALARAGIYNKRELEGVSDIRLDQFFNKLNGHFQVKKSIRDMCVFAKHNFLKDPPFSKIDLISCRNVLIYMEAFLQKKAFTTFHYSLNEKGYLLLGKSETVSGVPELFLSFGNKEKIFIRNTVPARFMTVASEASEEMLKDKDYGIRSNERKKDDFQKNADDVLLSKYTPAGVIVNDRFDIVQFRGATGDYLESSPGKPNLNVLKMVREGLSFELRNGLHKSKTTGDIFVKEGISINNGKKFITLEIIPLLKTIDLHFLILFKDTAYPISGILEKQQSGSDHLETEKDHRILQLEKDFSQARDDMQSITEDQEAVNEELQSANEELLSSSEELQSLNEELETSREELQSTNEELIIVNQELFDRNEQLNQARLFAEGIITTIHEPLLVLSQDFKIISANKSFYKDFVLTEEETVGKLLFELQNNQWNIPGLEKQLSRIQTNKEKFLEWEINYLFPIGNRTICFNAQPIQIENKENWILLAFNDITIRKEKEKIEKKTAEDLKQILENLPQITTTASAEGSLTYFNKFFLDYSGLTFDEAIDHGWASVTKPEVAEQIKTSWAHAVAEGESFNMELQLKRNSDNMFRWHLCRASAIRNEEGIITSWVGAATDIHEQKTKEQAKDEFISVASHELKTPLTTAKAYIQLLQLSMESSNDKNLDYAQKASTSIDRLNDLIGELLDVSKLQYGKLGLKIMAMDFNEMVAEAVEEVQFGSPSHIIIKQGSIPQKVTGDKERLKQVVINMLTNAVKYSPGADKVLVDISADSDTVKVSVKDTGIGIQKENLQKIFERYYREEERDVRFQGLGIGLFISHEIILRHKGKIWAESEQGEGSTFYFTVPIG